MADIEHEHEWVDDTVHAMFKCTCGALLTHEMIHTFSQASDRTLTPQIMAQLARAELIVED